MTIQHLYPTTRPSLDLNFARTKRLDPRVTFTRGSTATYVGSDGLIKTAASNEARFDHDPTTGESLGLLVEEARTNDLKYSSYPSLWGGNIGVTVQTKAGIAPDGTFSAELVKQDTATSSHSLRQYGATPNASTYRISCFLKYSGHRYVAILCNINAGLYGCFDLVDGAASVGTITNIGNGWFYCQSINYTGSSINTLAISLTNTFSSSYGSHGASGPTYAGDGVSGIFVWGVQTEVGSFATSHIPTPATFTSRASTATYYDANGTIQTAGSNVARSNAYFPDANGVMRPAGLLLEAAATNLVTYSEEFDNAAWSKISTISANATTAPDGTATADKLVSLNGSNRFCVYRYLTMTANKIQTFSCYGKASEWNFMTLVIGKQGSPYTRDSYTIDLSSGAVNKGPWTSNSVLVTNLAKQKLANGWWRLSISVQVDASSTDLHLEIGTSPTNQYNNGMSGDGTSGIFIWGAQWEQDASYSTSYIPTSGSTVTRSADVSSSSTVTRSADVASMTASPYLYGTFFARYKQQPPTGLYRQIFSVGVASAYGAFVCRTQPNDTVNIVLPSIADLTTTTNTGTSGFNNVATARVLGDYAVCLNGGTVAKTSSTSDQTNNSVITFMYGTIGATSGGHISRFTYYPTRLTDAQLQALTL